MLYNLPQGCKFNQVDPVTLLHLLTDVYKTYCMAENIVGIKHWQIHLFTLLEGEKFGKWPNNGKWILKIM